MTFTRDDLIQQIKAKPFRPFKVRLRDGRILNVRESEDLWAGLSGWLVYDSGKNDLTFANVESVVDIATPRPRRVTR